MVDMKKTREIIMRVFVIVVAVLSLVGHRVTATGQTKTHLIGQDGLCLDSNGPSRYNFPKLVPCKAEADTQLWTFPDDGTVRWTDDKCLFPYGMKVLKTYILVRTGQCNELQDEEKTWSLNNKGALVHVHSGLVLTVQNSTKTVNVEAYRNVPSQIWNVVNRVPSHRRVGHIIGLHSYECLVIYSDAFPVIDSLSCTSNLETKQLWVVYEDGTIRANANESMCLTSTNHKEIPGPYSMIFAVPCIQGKVEQQWEMNVQDFTIHHPDSTLVLDVILLGREPYTQKMVTLFTRNGAATQQWTFME